MKKIIMTNILKCIESDKYVSGQTIAKLCEISTSSVSRYLKELQADGIIYRENRNRPWCILEDIEKYDDAKYDVEIDLEANIVGIDRTIILNDEGRYTKQRLANDRRSLRFNITSPNGRLYKAFKTQNPKKILNVAFRENHWFTCKFCNLASTEVINEYSLGKHNLLTNYFSACKTKYLEVLEAKSPVWSNICDILCTDVLGEQQLLNQILKDYIDVLTYIKDLNQKTNEKTILASLKSRQEKRLETDAFKHSKMDDINVYEALSKTENHLALYWMLWCSINELLKNGSLGNVQFSVSYSKK